MTTTYDRLQMNGYLAAYLTTTNPVLANRELMFELDTRRYKIGDGVTAWNALPYIPGLYEASQWIDPTRVNVYADLGAGTADDKGIIEAAYAQLVANGGGTLYWPYIGRPYRFSSFVFDARDCPVTFEFAPGVLMRPISSGTGPAITVTSSTAVASGSGFNRYHRFRGLNLTSGTYIGNLTQIARPGMLLRNVQDLILDDCVINGFSGVGLQFDGVWDSRFTNLLLTACGHATTSTDYAYALEMTVGTIGGGSNANVFTGCHIEQAPLGIHYTGGARLNMWLGGKYETGVQIPNTDQTHSPVWLEDVTENSWSGAMFTNDIPLSTWFIMANQTPNSYETNAYARRHNVFSACMFSSNWAGTSNHSFRPANGAYLAFEGCSFNRVDGATGGAFRLHQGSRVIDCTIGLYSNDVSVFQISDTGVTIRGGTIVNPSSTDGGQALFSFDAAYDDCWIDCPALTGSFTIMVNSAPTFLGNGRYAQAGGSRAQASSTTVSAFMFDWIDLSLTAAGSITYFNHGHVGKILVLHATTGNTTLVNGSSTMALKGGASRKLSTDDMVQLVCSPSGVWREI